MTLSTTLNIVLALVAVFQWLDRRSKKKAIENVILSTLHIAKRLRSCNNKEAIQQKSLDICQNLEATLNTINGIFSWKKNGKRYR